MESTSIFIPAPNRNGAKLTLASPSTSLAFSALPKTKKTFYADAIAVCFLEDMLHKF